MEIFQSEYASNYLTYTFAYAVYCRMDTLDELPDILARGFLPYTGRLDLDGEYFYLARSLRIDLARFEDTSENRRVDRRVAELGLTLEVSTKPEFGIDSDAFREFCTRYAEERFSGGGMSGERLDYILRRESLSHVLTFRRESEPAGYVLLPWQADSAQYWFSFYHTAYREQYSLGKWMMWRTLRWAKEQGCRYLYLGTCYTPKALYKARDHKGVEFFDGRGWNPDRRLLTDLCARDEGPLPDGDLFKSQDPGFAVLTNPPEFPSARTDRTLA